MRPSRVLCPTVALLLGSTVFLVAGCGSGSPPRALPSASSSATASTPTPGLSTSEPGPTTVAPTPTPAGSTTPGPDWTVVSARVAVAWTEPYRVWPVEVRHSYRTPPVAKLAAIGVADHHNEPEVRPYNRMSFTFTTGFPTYRFKYEPSWVDERGQSVVLAGGILLVIVFTPAQAHYADGRSSVGSQPPVRPGLSRMVFYRQLADSEEHLLYSIGVPWTQPDTMTPPHYPIRVYEVTYVSRQGEHRFVVAFDIDAR